MDIAVAPATTPIDDQTVAAAYEIAAASYRVDVPDIPPPCRHNFAVGVREPWPGEDQEWVFARIDGALVGYLKIGLPTLDNTANVFIDVFVHPEHRRRGAGRALHAYAVRRGRELGRKRLMLGCVGELPGGPERNPAGVAFCAAVGASAALTEVRRRLDLTTVDPAAHDKLLAQAWERAAGYSLVQWVNRSPEEYIDDIAYLDGRLIQDAPMGDLAVEPEKVDADRIRAAEAMLIRRGRRTYHTGVRHDETGRLVCWTALGRQQSVDWHAWQQITIVEPRHRGHRLGTIVKIENLRHALASEPALRYIDTHNADTNDHMISINEAMGFRPVDTSIDWQMDI
jgi:GNAT superfamily N-acetyltransferase/RimJ/RimL family protein N-acetyltransferase